LTSIFKRFILWVNLNLKGTLRRTLSIRHASHSNIIQRRVLCERPCGDGQGFYFAIPSK
jgi:hypothetical protein